MYQRFFKRLFDVFLASVILLIMSPVMVVVIICFLIANRGQLFFMQLRTGKGHKTFRIIKFKTMNELKDEKGVLLSDEKRLTPIGSFVRKTSFDELPQLLNVLKGDMSLTGPRPLLTEYLSLYNKDQIRRHEVRPGITGWAQVNGRNAISWEEKFRYDVWYVDNISFWLDLRILFLTIQKVFRSDGISASGEASMPKFKGNRVNEEI